MIQSISIRNIALIDRLTIFFHSGLQVLSGETGAGKSIVVDAMKLILGGRAGRTLIRSERFREWYSSQRCRTSGTSVAGGAQTERSLGRE